MATDTSKEKGVIANVKDGLDGCEQVGGCATSNGCFTFAAVVLIGILVYCFVCGIITTAGIVDWVNEQMASDTASTTTADDDGVPARRIRVSPVNVRSGPGKKNSRVAVLRAGDWVYPTGETKTVGKGKKAEVWVRVQYEDPTGILAYGWVMEQFLAPDENYP